MIPDAYFERFQTPKYRERSRLKRALLRRFAGKVHDLFARAGAVGSVLEVGMGEGFLSGYLSERYPGVRFSGLDRDAAALERAGALFPRIAIHHGSVYDLRAVGSTFDLVMCCEVLEHLHDPERAVAELASATHHRALITVPHEPYFRLSNLLRGKNVRRLGNDEDHHQHWGPRGLRKLLAQRFDVLEMTTSYPFLLAFCAPRRPS